MNIQPCCIIEVPLAATDLNILTEMWAAFVVTDVAPQVDGSYTLQVEFLGCEEDEGKVAVTERFGRAPFLLHICVSRPCIVLHEDGGGRSVIHVTQFRMWTVENFAAEYVTAAAMVGVGKMVKQILAKNKPNTRGKRPKQKAAPKAPAGKTPRRSRDKEKEPEPDKEKDESKPGVEISEEQRAELRRRLGALRKKHHGEPPEPPEVEDLREDSAEDGRAGEDVESTPYEPSEPLDTGTRLKEKSLPRASKSRKEKEGRVVPYKDTSAEGTKNLRSHLLERALACGRAR